MIDSQNYGRDDVLKHYVRKNGWLPACEEHKTLFKRHWKGNPLRYFTFCAVEAIDVFLLEREGILQRSPETGRLEGVYFCESNPEDFGTIARLVGSPAQGFRGNFDKIVLFEDDDDTRGRLLYDDDDYNDPNPSDPKDSEEENEKSALIREKLKRKDAHLRLQDAFPFDIINLDVFGVMFPLKKGVIGPLVKSLLKILQWQTDTLDKKTKKPLNQFTLLLTSHIDPDITDTEAIELLCTRLQENINSHGHFADSFGEKYNHKDADRLKKDNFAEFFCLSLPKLIISKALFDMGWKVGYKASYLYDRRNKYKSGHTYQMMHCVLVFERIAKRKSNEGFSSSNEADEYTRAIMQVVNGDIITVESCISDPAVVRELQQDWDSVIDFRDKKQL